MEPTINLKNIIQLDKVETLLSTLINQIDTQEKKIKLLEERCDTFVPQNSFDDVTFSIHDKFKDVDKKLHLLKDASTSKLNDSMSISSGELSYLNSIQIENITKQLSTLAKSDDVNKLTEKIIQQFQNDITVLKETTTPLTMSEKLYQHHYEIHQRLLTLENIVNTKVDKNDISHIEALVAKLELYESFKTHVIQDIHEIKQKLTYHQQRLNTTTDDIQTLQYQMNTVDNYLKTCTTKNETRVIAKLVEMNTKKLEECVTIKEFHQTKELLEVAHKEIQTLQDYIKQLDEFTIQIHKELQDKANTMELRKYVLRQHYDEVITVLGSTLDEKGDKIVIETLQKHFTELQYNQQIDHDNINIAIKFVDWFTKRGDMYEHNMRIIDKHLGKLSENSHPHTTNIAPVPYDNHIKNQPSTQTYVQQYRRAHHYDPTNIMLQTEEVQDRVRTPPEQTSIYDYQLVHPSQQQTIARDTYNLDSSDNSTLGNILNEYINIQDETALADDPTYIYWS